MIVKRMWQGGPLRQFSDKPFKGSTPVTGGHVGAYICDVNDHITPPDGEDGGVRCHDGRWLCVPCGERHDRDMARLRRRLLSKCTKNQPNLMVSGGVIDRGVAA